MWCLSKVAVELSNLLSLYCRILTYTVVYCRILSNCHTVDTVELSQYCRLLSNTTVELSNWGSDLQLCSTSRGPRGQVASRHAHARQPASRTLRHQTTAPYAPHTKPHKTGRQPCGHTVWPATQRVDSEARPRAEPWGPRAIPDSH